MFSNVRTHDIRTRLWLVLVNLRSHSNMLWECVNAASIVRYSRLHQLASTATDFQTQSFLDTMKPVPPSCSCKWGTFQYRNSTILPPDILHAARSAQLPQPYLPPLLALHVLLLHMRHDCQYACLASMGMHDNEEHDKFACKRFVSSHKLTAAVMKLRSNVQGRMGPCL